jgi:hypothetical protein
VKTIRLLNRTAAAVAAALVLVATDGALAKGNNGGDRDHGQMNSHDSKSDHSDKHSEKNKDKSGEMRAEKHKDKDSKHADKMKDKDDDKHAEKTKDKDKYKDKTTTTSTTTANGTTPATPAPGSDKDPFGKGIVGPNTNLKPVPSSAAPGTPAPGATPGPAPINTIHPIPSPAAGPGNGIIRVSDGKGNSVIIPDHGSGVTVTPAGPGHVTISNGVVSRTVSGIALTISGAKTVSVDKSLGTGPRQADGSTTVLTPNGTVTGGADPNAYGGLSGFLTGGDFEAHPK